MSTNESTSLSPLAASVLEDHRRAPTAAFYDLLRLGVTFMTADLQRLDSAYSELAAAGYVHQVPGASVNVGGNLKPTYRLKSSAAA